MLSLANGQQTGTRGCWRKKKKQMSSNLNKHLGALRAASSTGVLEQINLIVGNRGSVLERDFYTKLTLIEA